MVLITKRNMQNNFKTKKYRKKCIYFSSLFYIYMVFGSIAISFKCAFLRGIECFLLRKNNSNFSEATREKLFTTMTLLGMTRDLTCQRLWRHNCFSNSIQFELIYFISIWPSQNLLKIRTFLWIRKRNYLFDHRSYFFQIQLLQYKVQFTCEREYTPE